jgi:hypothetical protein
MVQMAACVHALACVGCAAGGEAFRAAAGDAVAVLLVNTLAIDVLLNDHLAQASASHAGQHNTREASADTAALQTMYPSPLSPH